jgi:hypothetical protein
MNSPGSVPLIEFTTSTPLVDATQWAVVGRATGTVNPGVIWVNRRPGRGRGDVPIDAHSGRDLGVRAGSPVSFRDLSRLVR